MSRDKTVSGILKKDAKSKSQVKNKFRQFAVAAMALILSLAIISGCSTPKYAVTLKDGSNNEVEKFTTGEYLAFLYHTLSASASSQLYNYYLQSGTDDKIWDQTVPYSGGEDANATLPLEKHMVQSTQDSIVYYNAIEKIMKDNKFEFSEEDNKKIADAVASYSALGDKLGFNKESFEKVIRKAYGEQVLFTALYGEGGTKAVSEADKKTFHKENLYTYKIIEKKLTDSENLALSEEELKKIDDTLKGYLEAFNKDDKKDFNAILKQDYDATKAEDAEDFKVDDKLAAIDQNLSYMYVPQKSNEAMAEQIKGINVGEAKIVEYANTSGVKVKALIYRVDVEQTADYKYDKQKDTVLSYMKYEEYEKDVDAVAKTFKFEIDPAILKKCTPRQMIADSNKK